VTAKTEQVTAEELADRFRQLRERAGLTKTSLARPRYTVSYVSQIERGRRRPSPEALSFFADRLGVTAEYLGTGLPEGLEDILRYRLDEARQLMRGGGPAEAAGELQELLEETTLRGMRPLRAEILVTLGDARVGMGRVNEGIDTYEEALEIAWPESTRTAAAAVEGLATACRSVGDLTYAAGRVESFLAQVSHDAPLDPASMSRLQMALVSIYFERGDMAQAERCAERGLAAADTGAPMDVRALAYWNASRVYAERRRWNEALELATRARVLMEELDDRRNVARLHNALAFICLETDPPRTDQAEEHLDLAESTLREVGSPSDRAYVLTERARLALLRGRPGEAVGHADASLASGGEDELELARCLFIKGRALASLDRRDEARESLTDAAAIFGRHGARQQEASCWREIGEMDLAAGDGEAALRALREGLEALDPNRSRA
jgi:tetratricopeptide (TPR) repeat protein